MKRQIMAVSPRKLSGLPDRVATYEPQGIAAQDQGLFPRAKPEQSDFGDLDTRVQPRPIGAEEKFAWSRTFDRLDNVIELAHSRRVGEHIRVTSQLVSDLLMRAEIIGVAAQVRNDEIDVGVLRRDHVDDLGAAGDIDE